jgi:hypothetical protein
MSPFKITADIKIYHRNKEIVLPENVSIGELYFGNDIADSYGIYYIHDIRDILAYSDEDFIKFFKSLPFEVNNLNLSEILHPKYTMKPFIEEPLPTTFHKYKMKFKFDRWLFTSSEWYIINNEKIYKVEEIHV